MRFTELLASIDDYKIRQEVPIFNNGQDDGDWWGTGHSQREEEIIEECWKREQEVLEERECHEREIEQHMREMCEQMDVLSNLVGEAIAETMW